MLYKLSKFCPANGGDFRVRFEPLSEILHFVHLHKGHQKKLTKLCNVFGSKPYMKMDMTNSGVPSPKTWGLNCLLLIILRRHIIAITILQYRQIEISFYILYGQLHTPKI